MNFIKYMGATYLVAFNTIGVINISSPFLNGIASGGVLVGFLWMIEFLRRR